MATSSANRGKVAEKKVREILDGFNKRVASFTFNRVPDAHMAGGRFPAQAGDFQAFFRDGRMAYVVLSQHPIGPTIELKDAAPFRPSRNFIIEVKETSFDFRLPAKNYSADKVARVQVRVWAGTEAVVVVLHKTTGLWRLVPFSVFTERKPSWDLRAYPHVDIEAALAEFMGVN